VHSSLCAEIRVAHASILTDMSLLVASSAGVGTASSGCQLNLVSIRGHMVALSNVMCVCKCLVCQVHCSLTSTYCVLARSTSLVRKAVALERFCTSSVSNPVTSAVRNALSCITAPTSDAKTSYQPCANERPPPILN
jgi:hypothetical protein